MKLFVLVRRDLATVHRAVQAGHAVAQWCLERGRGAWDGTLVYLGVPDELELRVFGGVFAERGIPFEVFREPDFENSATALAVCHSEAAPLVRHLSLLRA